MFTVRFIPTIFRSPEDARYEHNIVALAEGLHDLGVTYKSSSDYWPLPEGGSLLRATPLDGDPVLQVLSHESFPFSSSIDYGNAVYIDSADGWRTASLSPGFPSFRWILRSHYNDHYRYSKETVPWTFGLTRRIIEAAQPEIDWQDRADTVLFNFRAGHPLRRFIADSLISKLGVRFPVDSRTDPLNKPESENIAELWSLTGRRHSLSYYNRLRTSKICAAFGGYFAPCISKSLNSIIERLAYRQVFKLGLRTNTVMQWDSWRLWEAWAAGCVVLHVDFVKYGCKFPEQPQNWVHYVGFDLDRLDEGIERFLSLSDGQLESIALVGRKWAIANYSPKAVADRFLALVGLHV